MPTSTTRRARCAACTPRSTRRAHAGEATVDWTDPRAAAFREAMNDDFNTPIAVSVLFELAGEVNRKRQPADAALLKGLGGTLGLLQQSPRAFLQAGAGLDGSQASPSASRRAPKPSARATSPAPTRSARNWPGSASSSRTARKAPPGCKG